MAIRSRRKYQHQGSGPETRAPKPSVLKKLGRPLRDGEKQLLKLLAVVCVTQYLQGTEAEEAKEITPEVKPEPCGTVDSVVVPRPLGEKARAHASNQERD